MASNIPALPDGFTLDQPGSTPPLPDGFTLDSPAPSAATQPSLGSDISNYLSGIGAGLYTVPQSIAELGARGLDVTGLTKNAYSDVHSAFQDMNNIANPNPDKYYTGGKAIGAAAATLPVLAAAPFSGAGVFATAGNAALQGGLSAALTSSNSSDPLWQQVGKGALIGGAAGGALGAAAPVARAAGNTVAAALGTATGAGGRAIKGAFQAGMAGGDAADAFTNNMRNNASMMDVVGQAKAALSDIRAQRNAQYRSGMLDISGDKSVLDFTPIQKAADDAENLQSYKGQTIGGDADATSQALNGAVSNWAQLDPAEYHTPEGLDFLKQQIGDIVANTKPNTVSSTMAGKVYNAIKGTIQAQAPTYAKVMSDYSDASESINNIQREISLGQKANPATALKKLQSVMSDNVNTSWGQRADYANQLDQSGTLMPALAGQALQTVMPRGIAGPLEAAGAIGAAAFGAPHTLAAAPFMSPRLMGETAYGLGKGVGALGRLPLSVNAILAKAQLPLAVPPLALSKLPAGLFGGAPNLVGQNNSSQ